MNLADDMTPYRVGLGRDLHAARIAFRHRDWMRLRARLRWILRSIGRRSWWGLWQVEWPGCHKAVRGVTASHAYRRAKKRRAARGGER